ncbi:glycoside hydrolase family 3 C-terminal domain-containing protein [Actinoplanes sp. N902-109]|uniref:glycoside hydrolase family 3 C-terminal domain-containing protein n=1 Tax=Actinoplanes sp. (strain N902-109) TaxID=649831 RepID=UPI00032966CD|nr:glycoside hydrolase family 3 C-terminal domain-containing protein [Actinoplanes sp. N902-109]AGL14242.1 Glycoside hydrolase family 3 protein [Actinoplanes sp. N902-109]
MRLARIALAVVLGCGVLAAVGGPEDQLAPAQRAEALLQRMTRDEKLTLLHGGSACGYVGCVDGIERLGIPALHLQDGPAGVGGGLTGVTQLPAPVAAAAAWDPGVLSSYGKVLGAEHRGKGSDVVLAPTVNIVRDPRWGRAFESLGEDPYLTGRSAAAEIEAIQAEGPMAQVKHYAVYNQETARNTPAGNATIDERTLHEIYLPAFEDAVAAGVDSVMCGYNPVNGVFPCENGDLQNRILRDQLGFPGFITSDWDATHSTVASALNGLDMEMPDAQYFGPPLTASGLDVDEHVRRILTAMFRRGLFDHPSTGSLTAPVTSVSHAKTAREIAEQGMVLLKNDGDVLPIGGGVHSIAVIGNGGDAGVLSQGGGSATVSAPYVISPYQGLKERGGPVTYQPGTARADGALPTVPLTLTGSVFPNTALSGPAIATRTDAGLDGTWRGGDPGTGIASDWSARWTGTLIPPTTGTYTFSLTNTDGARLTIGDKLLIDNGWTERSLRTTSRSIYLTGGQPVPVTLTFAQYTGNAAVSLGWTRPGQNLHDDAVRAAASADLAVVVVGRFSTEGADLSDLDLPAAQNALVTDVAAANPNTVVIVNSGSAITMPWASRVRGIVEAWYPGQEYGHALADLLHGDANFSAKLPVTFPRALSDAPAFAPARWPGGRYSEGLQVGYRWYDARGIEPLFPFGYGLSYTTFKYSDLKLSGATVSFTLTNTGPRAGAEVAQVYVQQPAATGEPIRNLRGFTKLTLQPGQSQRVTIELDARSFQHWTGTWTTSPGTYTISVGSSSRDLPLAASMSRP